MTDTEIHALSIKAAAERDYPTLALCLLALGVHPLTMYPHVRAAIPPDVCGVVALRMLRAAPYPADLPACPPLTSPRAPR